MKKLAILLLLTANAFADVNQAVIGFKIKVQFI